MQNKCEDKGRIKDLKRTASCKPLVFKHIHKKSGVDTKTALKSYG